MTIQYIEPFSRGFSRMKKALFQPFNLKKWFVVGFTAWLAGLLDGGHGGGGNNGNSFNGDFGDVLDAPYKAWMWLQENPEWTIAVMFGIAFLLFIFIVLTWISSRGKFMFVDNVVHDRALVSQPWHDYSKQGDSLFGWRIIFGFISLTIVLAFLYQAWQKLYALYFGSFDESIPWAFLIRTIILFILLLFVIGYIELLLNEFIVAIMYKHRITAGQAWHKLLSIHSQHFAHFLLFAAFWLALSILAFIMVAFGCLITCCLGLLLLIIPYINAVLLLPFSYTFRAFSLEFLAQFGDDYTVFSNEENNITAVG